MVHPSYKEMVAKAIKGLKKRNGTGRASIAKFILANFEVNATVNTRSIREALKKGVVAGDFIQIKQSFKNSEAGKKALVAKPKKIKATKPKKKVTKKKTATKAKKTTTKAKKPKTKAKKSKSGKKKSKSAKKTKAKKGSKKASKKAE
jgi:histone H1/5